jgi:hypothetical protein
MSDAEIATAKCSLSFIRRPQYVNFLGRYSILVNDHLIGKLRRNGVLKCEVETGEVVIDAKIDWCGSSPLFVHLKPGEHATIEVFNGTGLSLDLLSALLCQTPYLTLRRVDDPSTDVTPSDCPDSHR